MEESILIVIFILVLMFVCLFAGFSAGLGEVEQDNKYKEDKKNIERDSKIKALDIMFNDLVKDIGKLRRAVFNIDEKLDRIDREVNDLKKKRKKAK